MSIAFNLPARVEHRSGTRTVLRAPIFEVTEQFLPKPNAKSWMLNQCECCSSTTNYHLHVSADGPRVTIMSLKKAGPVILAYNGHSDADSTHRPGDSRWQQCSPDWVRKVYLAKLAQKYMEDTKQAEAGKQPLFWVVCYFCHCYNNNDTIQSDACTVICLSRRVPQGFFWAKMLVYFDCTFQGTKNCCPRRVVLHVVWASSCTTHQFGVFQGHSRVFKNSPLAMLLQALPISLLMVSCSLHLCQYPC